MAFSQVLILVFACWTLPTLSCPCTNDAGRTRNANPSHLLQELLLAVTIPDSYVSKVTWYPHRVSSHMLFNYNQFLSFLVFEIERRLYGMVYRIHWKFDAKKLCLLYDQQLMVFVIVYITVNVIVVKEDTLVLSVHCGALHSVSSFVHAANSL